MSLEALTIGEVIDTFDLMDDWEERYRYLIELGRKLPPFPDDAPWRSTIGHDATGSPRSAVTGFDSTTAMRAGSKW